MARLSRPPPPSRARRTIFSSSSESESEHDSSNSNSDPDSDFPDIAKKNDNAPSTRRKRPAPPTDTTSNSSDRRTVVESVTSPNAASSKVTGGGVKRRKLLLGAVSDNVLFRKWAPAQEEDEAPVRKKRRNLAAINNNPFGSRLPLGMGDEGDREDSEAENLGVWKKKKKDKEVKSVGETTVTGKKVVKTTTESLSSEKALQEKLRKGLKDTSEAKKEKRPPASLGQSTKQVVSKSKDMMEIDKDEEMDIFEDLEDFAEESFHTACSRDSSVSNGEESKTGVTTAPKTNMASNPKDDDDSDEDLDAFFSKLNSKPKIPMVRESHLSPTKPRSTKNSRSRQMDTTWESQSRTLFDDSESDERQSRTASSDEDTCGEEDVTQDFSCLQLESSSSSSSESSETETERSRPKKQRTRTPSPPPKIPKLKPRTAATTSATTTTTLPPSPKKLPRIPSTPHRPSSDLFWSREFVDDWNDEHSPVKKELFFPSSTKPPPPSSETTTASPKKRQPLAPSPSKLAAAQARESRLLRQAFNTHKHSLATTFLSLLDTRLTSGRLSTLTANTGGIKILWSKTLNTTAGRANWKKESITSRPCRQAETKEVKHHASIELATKVLSTPERLFNTLAHEFCHLAVFMIDGVTTRPHGAEFKAWARRANEEFGGGRPGGNKEGEVVGKLNTEEGKWEGGYSVEVTTRHGYEIEFRYVWVCDGPAPDVGKGCDGDAKKGGCGTEYKRHSKSVDPARHRCGVCKGVLRQVKPVPRGQATMPTGATGGEKSGRQQEGTGGMGTTKIKEKAKTSEYQVFVKEQMKVVKAQKPGLAFGEVMKEVAERWKLEKAKREKEKGPKNSEAVPVGRKVGKLSTLLEDVVVDEDDSPGMLEDEEMMDVVDLTADD